MYKGKRLLGGIFWGICLFVLILDTKTVLHGAGEGLDICIRILIPSIFPFLVVCTMVTANWTGTRLLRPVGKLLRLPTGAEDLFLLGLFSGYPVGANMVSQAVQNRRISRYDGRRLLAFCSNAGPSFIFGIGATLFPNIGYCAVLWLIQIISASIVAILTPGKPEKANAKHCPAPTLQQTLHKSLLTMGIICGWVVLFRILITVLERWVLWFLPAEAQILARGILELANGIVSLVHISNLGQRMIYFSVLLSFGGICVWIQTLSVTDGVSANYYLPGKLAQCAISGLLATTVQFMLPVSQRFWPNPLLFMLSLIICIIYPFFLRKNKNRTRNPGLVGV